MKGLCVALDSYSGSQLQPSAIPSCHTVQNQSAICHAYSIHFFAVQMWSIVLIKYLQVQNVVISPALVTLSTFIMNIGFNFGFIAAFGYRVSIEVRSS